MSSRSAWLPPGKNCGQCGQDSCQSFVNLLITAEKTYSDCPYYDGRAAGERVDPRGQPSPPGRDFLGHVYDFVLTPLPGEVSARKIVLPFRPDLVEKLTIQSGDLVLGRPMGAGCPIPHVLQVIKAEPVTGLLYTWVVGPRYSREQAVKDVVAYHMVGFEGIASYINQQPEVGCRATFLPGFCMMALNHTGLVNMVLQKNGQPHVRLEDIRILAGKAQ